MKKLKKILFILLAGYMASCFASSDTYPQYLPGGTVPTFSLYDALSPMPQLKQKEWWYFVGLVHDQTAQAHSLQVEIIRSTLFGKNAGFGSIGFSFINSLGKADYLWNAYFNNQMLPHYAVGSFNYNNAINPNFQITTNSNPGNNASPFIYTFSHNPNSPAVGQIGAEYTIQATGIGEVGAAANTIELVHYNCELTLKDTRGLVPEGMNGFVGNISKNIQNPTNSWEFTLPNMQVLFWKMRISPAQTTTAQSPVQNTLTFSNEQQSDRIWLDRQILYSPTTQQTNFKSTPNFLYTGTWMSFCFNQGNLKGLCADAVAFWNPGTQTSAMNSNENANGGFINLFTPDSNGTGFPQSVGSTQTEVLSFNSTQNQLPFRIENEPSSVFTSPLSQHHYAGTVYITLKKDTPFSADFDQLSNHMSQDQNYVLKLQVLSPLTENIFGENSGGFYEGAATVSLCNAEGKDCVQDGTGFMEQMGYE